MKTIVKETIAHWKSHNAPRMGAALSYYTMLSFVPLLLLLVTFASSLFSEDLVHGTLVIELSRVIGGAAAQYVDGLLRTDALQNVTVATALLGALITFFGAVGIFAELDNDFNVLWDTPKQPTIHIKLWPSIRAYIQKKIAVFSFVPLLVILLIVVVGITIFFGVLGSVVVLPSSFTFLVEVARFGAPLVLGVALFMTTYRVLPARKLPWKVLFVGALVTTILFIIGNSFILSYIKLLVHTNVFGGAASLVGLLVWVYYSAQVFFLGASFTYVYAMRTTSFREKALS